MRKYVHKSKHRHPDKTRTCVSTYGRQVRGQVRLFYCRPAGRWAGTSNEGRLGLKMVSHQATASKRGAQIVVRKQMDSLRGLIHKGSSRQQFLLLLLIRRRNAQRHSAAMNPSQLASSEPVGIIRNPCAAWPAEGSK